MRSLINSGYRYAYSLCANTADAEDLVQEAWARLTSHGGVRDQAQLFTTIKRLYIDQYRRSRIVQFVPLSPSHDTEPDGRHTGTSPDAMLIVQAMSQLRHEEREVLYLSIIEGYTAKEMSELLDKPRNTILSQIHRAKARLAQVLLSTDTEHAKPCVR